MPAARFFLLGYAVYLISKYFNSLSCIKIKTITYLTFNIREREVSHNVLKSLSGITVYDKLLGDKFPPGGVDDTTASIKR